MLSEHGHRRWRLSEGSELVPSETLNSGGFMNLFRRLPPESFTSDGFMNLFLRLPSESFTFDGLMNLFLRLSERI